ncbi:Tryptophan aminotransferase-related protein 2-like [Forsythia ovata]|uniref:Tryptophan aminotransferase-related protein 2-like n=1 Tax=Forsythia ovata TaxID=205694 RepID=A0ABD1P442_9LAMI
MASSVAEKRLKNLGVYGQSWNDNKPQENHKMMVLDSKTELRTMILGNFLVIALNAGFLYRDYCKGKHHYQEFFSFKNECKNASLTLLKTSPPPFSSSSSKAFDGIIDLDP